MDLIRVLYVAYPLLTVSRESVGGAEQILWTLEREMAGRGVETAVAASAGSAVTGELCATGEACVRADDLERRNREHEERVLDLVRSRARQGRPFSLIHDHSGSFWPRAGELDCPALATLHLPRSFYPARHFENVPATASFNCVSFFQAGGFAGSQAGGLAGSQADSFAGLAGFRGVVANGIPLDLFETDHDADHRSRNGLLWLGRICEEKGPHLALNVAAAAGMPITLAGQVYPFSYHQQYFDREIAPRLGKMRNAKFFPVPSHDCKRQLLREARALLITSQVDETSSLVAMEAAVSGTPVIAFARGALREIVRDGVTGFLVDNVEAAAAAVERIAQINPDTCQHHAREHFGSAAMAEGYARLYAQVLAQDSRSEDSRFEGSRPQVLSGR